MPMLRTTLAITILGLLCLMLAGCPGCTKKKPIPPALSGKNPAATKDIDSITGHFTGGYTIVIPMSGDRVLSATADSVDISRENGLQVFRFSKLTGQVYQHGVVTMQMSGDRAQATRQDQNKLDLDINGHVTAIETALHQQARAEVLHWNTEETTIKLTNFDFAGKNPGGEDYTLRAPAGIVNTTFTELHWTGRGTIEMIGAPRKR